MEEDNAGTAWRLPALLCRRLSQTAAGGELPGAQRGIQEKKGGGTTATDRDGLQEDRIQV